jgi:hypothetical protein
VCSALERTRNSLATASMAAITTTTVNNTTNSIDTTTDCTQTQNTHRTTLATPSCPPAQRVGGAKRPSGRSTFMLQPHLLQVKPMSTMSGRT